MFLQGEEDLNRPQARTIHDRLEALRFAHLGWVDMAGAGHTYADAEHLARAVELLDAPLE